MAASTVTTRRLRFYAVMGCGFVLLSVALAAGTLIGGSAIPAGDVLNALLHWGDTPQGMREVDARIVWLVRVPRVVLAASVGAMLAVAGVLLQGLFRNPLAAPGIVGVSQGAALGAVLALATGLGLRYVVAVPICAFVGSLLALLLIAGLAFRGGRTSVATLLLAGVALNFLISAGISLIISLSWQRYEVAVQIMLWLMGGLEGRSWYHIRIALPCLVAGSALGWWMARDLDLMLEGEEAARSLGVSTERVKLSLLIASAVLTAGAVAVSGVVGFVGLVIPHLVRLMIGPAHGQLLPASAVTGAWFLVCADLVARTIRSPHEIHLGIVTACIGAPFFLYLLLRHQKEASLL